MPGTSGASSTRRRPGSCRPAAARPRPCRPARRTATPRRARAPIASGRPPARRSPRRPRRRSRCRQPRGPGCASRRRRPRSAASIVMLALRGGRPSPAPRPSCFAAVAVTPRWTAPPELLRGVPRAPARSSSCGSISMYGYRDGRWSKPSCRQGRSRSRMVKRRSFRPLREQRLGHAEGLQGLQRVGMDDRGARGVLPLRQAVDQQVVDPGLAQGRWRRRGRSVRRRRSALLSRFGSMIESPFINMC